jgi:transcription initiation factor TFIID subunit TAF12
MAGGSKWYQVVSSGIKWYQVVSRSGKKWTKEISQATTTNNKQTTNKQQTNNKQQQQQQQQTRDVCSYSGGTRNSARLPLLKADVGGSGWLNNG